MFFSTTTTNKKNKKKIIPYPVVENKMNVLYILPQTAESVAERMMNLASSDSVVMVTVDPVDDATITPMSSSSALAEPMVQEPSLGDMFGLGTISGSPPSLSSMSDGSSGHGNMSELSGMAAPLTPPGEQDGSDSGSVLADLMEGVLGAEGGINFSGPSSRDPNMRHGVSRHSSKPDSRKSEAAARTTPTNPMSVSVPNLTSNMEQTVSLLESFAAVARRNLGNNSSNIGRSSNTSSLVRLALSSNPNGK